MHAVPSPSIAVAPAKRHAHAGPRAAGHWGWGVLAVRQHVWHPAVRFLATAEHVAIALGAPLRAINAGIRTCVHAVIERPIRRFGRWIDARVIGVKRVVEVDEIDLTTTLTPGEIRRRGWSPEAMAALLGRPDYAVVNPLGRGMMKIRFVRQRVEQIESSGRLGAYGAEMVRRADATNAKIEKWVNMPDAPIR